MSGTSTLFELLVAQHRRRVLLLLCQTDSVQVPDGVRARGTTRSQQSSQASPQDVPPKTIESTSLEIQLIHNHLPKLEDKGLIEWNRESQTVTRGPCFDVVKPALEVLANNAEQFPDGLV